MMTDQKVLHAGMFPNGRNDDDKALLIGLQVGGEKDFELVFNTYYRCLLGFIKEYLPDLDIARDIVQETFITLWERKDLLNADTNLRAYLFTIARNKSLNHIKRIQLEKRTSSGTASRLAAEQLNYYALKDESALRVYQSEFEKLVAEGIDTLPEQCRKVFNLSRRGYLKNQQIADELNISVKTVESHLTKSLKILRKKLAAYSFWL
jgi:RNA polymerase sigma-70 factor (ECF subfamily)